MSPIQGPPPSAETIRHNNDELMANQSEAREAFEVLSRGGEYRHEVRGLTLIPNGDHIVVQNAQGEEAQIPNDVVAIFALFNSKQPFSDAVIVAGSQLRSVFERILNHVPTPPVQVYRD